MSDADDQDTPANSERGDRVPRIGELAGRLAGWSAARPGRVLVGAAVILLLSLLSLRQLHITTSLGAMLGDESEAAIAMERVTNEYQAGDALLLMVELPMGREADAAGREELVAFATRLEAALKRDPEASPLISWVRFREDSEVFRFAQEVMLPNGAFYLSDEGAAEMLRRLEPGQMREQFDRNEAMIGAPGPGGVALSGAILRDPLRLLELIPPDLRVGHTGGGIEATSALGESKPEFSEDQRAILIHIGSTGGGGDYEAAGRLVDVVLQWSAKLNTGQLRIAPAGAAAIARESSRVIRRDSVVSCIVSIGLLYMLFLVFYRRWSAGLLIGGVAGVGMLGGIGVLALFMREVSPLAAVIAALLAGLGTDYGIHFLSHYDGYRARGLGSAEASVQTARHMAMPIVTNCSTSIIGFVSLWPAKIQMLSDFAAMGAAGLLGALLAVFVLMPAALAVVDRRSGAVPAGRAMFGRLADMVAAKPRAWMVSSIAVIGVVIVAAMVQGSSLRFESDLTVMHPRPNRALDATAEVIRRFASEGELIPIEVRAPTSHALVEAVHDAAMALRSPECRAAGVTSVIGLHSLVPDPRGMATRRALLEQIDPDSVLASFDSTVEASAFAPSAYTGYRSFLETFVSARTAPTVGDVQKYPGLAGRVFPSIHGSGSAAPTSTVLVAKFAAPLRDRGQRRTAVDALQAAASSVRSGVVTVAGLAAVSAELEDAAQVGLPRSAALSFVLVLLWLILVFRNLPDVLLSLVPLVFATMATVFLAMATGQRVNPINGVAIPLLSGISVDAGVFLVSVYRAHGSTREGLREHLRSTTHAVLLSVGTTVTAFAALCFTHTPAVQSLGLASAVGIIASGVGALLLLMPILILRAPRRGSSQASVT